MEKKSKIIILILIILVVCAVAVSYFLTPSTIENKGAKNITDMANRSVQIPASVDRVIATAPPMTTIIYMLAPDKLTGVNFEWTDTELKYVPNQYKDIPVVGGWFGSQDGSYEEFIASEPDMVVESIDEGMGVNVDTVNERQAKFGEIPVVAVVNANNVETIPESITFMGEILGAQDKAKELVDFDEKYINLVKERTANMSDADKKTVYYAEGNDGLQTNPAGGTHGQLIDLVGGKNVADENQGNSSSGYQVSIEQVIKWNPDVIITTDPDFYNSVYSDSNWKDIDAVKNKEVYLSPQSPFKWFDRPSGANIIIGIPWVAKVIYPDQYKDINMVDVTQEFYSNFYHWDLSDDEAKNLLISSGLKEKNL